MTQRTCTIEGCEKLVSSRGWCNMHYLRWRKHGDVNWTPPTKPSCRINGCERPNDAQGLCSGHYQRFKKHGDPKHGGPLRPLYQSAEESFAARTERRGDCLVWTGAVLPNGYGTLRVDGRLTYAHRYAWERVNGPLDIETLIDHTCWNHACVTLDHLRPATKSENGAYRTGPGTHGTKGLPRNVRERRGRYYVEVTRGSEHHYAYGFSTVDEASEAAADLRARLFGEFAGKG